MSRELLAIAPTLLGVALSSWVSCVAFTSCRAKGKNAAKSGAATTSDERVEAITHATIIDPASGGVSQGDMTIVIRLARIVAIGPTGVVQIPSGAIVHDAYGQFVIPGLWDTHVHLSQVGPRAFPLLVENGITSVRDMGSDFGQILKWRTDREAGAIIPRIISPGPKIDGGPLMRRQLNANNPELDVVTSPAEARRTVDELRARGVDFIKVHNGLTPPLYDAIVEQCKKDRLAFAGHLPTAGPLAATAAGQRTIEHGRGMLFCSPDTWARIKSDPGLREDAEYCAPLDMQSQIFPALVHAGTWFTPTLVSWRGHAMTGDPSLSHLLTNLSGYSAVWPQLRDHWDEMAEAPPTTFERQLLGQFGGLASGASHAGVPLLAGTDLGESYVIPGYALHDELELMVAAGVTTLAALQSATSEPARAFGLTNTLGAIVVGQSADLVVLDGNPLVDIRNTRRIHAVLLNGHWTATGQSRVRDAGGAFIPALSATSDSLPAIAEP